MVILYNNKLKLGKNPSIEHLFPYFLSEFVKLREE